MTPVFVTKGLRLNSTARVIKEEHLKFRVEGESGRKIDGIGFGFSKYADDLNAGAVFDLAYTGGN